MKPMETVETIKGMMADPMQSGAIPERATECITFLLKLTDRLGAALDEIYQRAQCVDTPVSEMTDEDMEEFADLIESMAGAALVHYYYLTTEDIMRDEFGIGQDVPF